VPFANEEMKSAEIASLRDKAAKGGKRAGLLLSKKVYLEVISKLRKEHVEYKKGI